MPRSLSCSFFRSSCLSFSQCHEFQSGDLTSNSGPQVLNRTTSSSQHSLIKVSPLCGWGEPHYSLSHICIWPNRPSPSSFSSSGLAQRSVISHRGVPSLSQQCNGAGRPAQLRQYDISSMASS